MAGSDFLIELLGQHVNADGVLAWVQPKVELSENLVGEGAAHDEGWKENKQSIRTKLTNQIIFCY